MPVVSITTVYFGASPETIETTITEPIEQSLGGIEDIRSISSTSAFSTSQINIEFEIGRDIDVAATDVTNAVQRVTGSLPLEADQPVVSKSSAGGSGALMWISLYGDGYSAEEKTDIADRLVKTRLQLLPGIARIMIGGERRYAMRVWLDPAKMAAREVDATDVRRAIRSNNLQVPAGEIQGQGRKFTVNVNAQIDDPRIYERLVIRREGDQVVRIQGRRLGRARIVQLRDHHSRQRRSHGRRRSRAAVDGQHRGRQPGACVPCCPRSKPLSLRGSRFRLARTTRCSWRRLCGRPGAPY